MHAPSPVPRSLTEQERRCRECGALTHQGSMTRRTAGQVTEVTSYFKCGNDNREWTIVQFLKE